jgi:hypothetical protein
MYNTEEIPPKDELRLAKTTTRTIAETDLYRPVYNYLVKQGYTVRSEVINCDLAAVRGDELIIIELKRTASIALLAQAVQRQKITDSVYVAIPRPADKRRWMTQSKGLQLVLKRLEIGLILVSVNSRRPAVEIISHPSPADRRKRKSAHRAIIREISRRSADFNEGGSSRRKIVTAYRENAIQIASILSELGPLTPRALRALGTGEKTLSILSRNVYSWFERVSRGLYALSPGGRSELDTYRELAEYYRRQLDTTEAPPSPCDLQQEPVTPAAGPAERSL